MKIFIITLFAIITGSFAIAGELTSRDKKDNVKIISGKVIDKNTGEEIVGAEIKIDNKIIYTDLNGDFIASINPKETEVAISFISYNNAKINIEPFSYKKIVIELEAK